MEPCFPLISFLAKNRNQLEDAVSEVKETWANFQLINERFNFDETDYYTEEMGKPLYRWWGYRDVLGDPSDLVTWKHKCESVENSLRTNEGNRTVNLDPGYLNYGLLVLGSHKHHHQKIYLGEGVYADPILEYVDGSFRPFHWTFPDFQDDRYYPVFRDIRKKYKKLRANQK